MTSAATKRRTARQTIPAITEIVEVTEPYPSVRRITLRGKGLRAYREVYQPADAVKVLVPHGDGFALPTVDGERLSFPDGAPPPMFRPYTIRELRDEELDLDVVLHGPGPGAQWARNATPGERVALIGPRHDWWPADAPRLLLAGDETALPAIATIVESLPTGVDVHAIVEVGDRGDEQPLRSGASLRTTWLHRGTTPASESRLLETAVRAHSAPDTAYWVAAETFVVKPIRRYLRTELGLTADDVDAYGYWRNGVTITQVDVVVGQEYVRRVHAGSAPDDHHNISELDLDVPRDTASDVRQLFTAVTQKARR